MCDGKWAIVSNKPFIINSLQETTPKMSEDINSENVSVNSRLDAYLLSKCSLSLYSNNKLAKSVKPNKSINKNVAKVNRNRLS